MECPIIYMETTKFHFRGNHGAVTVLAPNRKINFFSADAIIAMVQHHARGSASKEDLAIEACPDDADILKIQAACPTHWVFQENSNLLFFIPVA